MEHVQKILRAVTPLAILAALGLGGYFAYHWVSQGVDAEMRKMEEKERAEGRKPFSKVRDEIQSAVDRTQGRGEFWEEMDGRK